MSFPDQPIRVAARFLLAGLADLEPNESVDVYHGTQLVHARKLMNGFDANKVVHRVYTSTGNRHAGVFVSPSFEVAKHFSSGGDTVLELSVRAKNLHGTNYGGTIGRHQPTDPETQEWLRSKYPDNFRPYLSYTLLQTTEPQALLRGLVKPMQIKRVWYQGTWYSRKAFLDLGVEVYSPHGRGAPLKEIGYDLSYPNYSLSEFYEALGAAAEVSVERARMTIERRQQLPSPRREKAIEDLLESVGFGPTAIRAYVRKLGEPSAARVAARWGRVY